MNRIKAGDTVQVRAGKDKGLEGTVLSVQGDRVLVEGVNEVVRHQKVTPGQSGAKEGGLIHREAPIHISNVMLVVDGKATRVGSKTIDGEQFDGSGNAYPKKKRVRVSKRTGKEVS